MAVLALKWTNGRASFKTPHFDQSPRWAQISILEIRNVFLRLKFSPALTLAKLKRFEIGSESWNVWSLGNSYRFFAMASWFLFMAIFNPGWMNS